MVLFKNNQSFAYGMGIWHFQIKLSFSNLWPMCFSHKWFYDPIGWLFRHNLHYYLFHLSLNGRRGSLRVQSWSFLVRELLVSLWTIFKAYIDHMGLHGKISLFSHINDSIILVKIENRIATPCCCSSLSSVLLILVWFFFFLFFVGFVQKTFHRSTLVVVVAVCVCLCSERKRRGESRACAVLNFRVCWRWIPWLDLILLCLFF